jgi:hypothetical protein
MQELYFERGMNDIEKKVRKRMKLDKEDEKEPKKEVKRLSGFVSPENKYIGEVVIPKKQNHILHYTTIQISI